jgi:DNA repair exonuclease SbcCD nuclease subunit
MYGTVTQGMTEFFLLPHQHTQALFEERLKFLCDLIQKKESKARFNVLCLHCNFGAHTGPEADNYLSPAMAKELLAAGFHLIVSGHEHNFRNPMPGVVMLGSILPMSFGEMEQKYVMDYDTQAGTYDLTHSWSTSGYCRVSWGELLAEECSTWNNYQFLEIVGDLEVDNAVKVNRQVSAILRACDNIIAVKNNTVLHKQSHKIDEASKANWMDTLMATCATDDHRDAIVALRAEVSRGKKKYAETE